MHCTYCADALPEAAVFCPKCGNRVSAARSEKPFAVQDPIPSNIVHTTALKPRWFKVLVYLAILFAGIISVDWAVSELFSLPAEATYQLTKMSLDAAMAVAALGLVFAKWWVTLKSTLVVTAILSIGIVLLVLSVRNTHHDQSSTEGQPSALSSTGQQQPVVPDIVLDDVAPGDDGDIFESTFIHDPSCEGLRLMRWKTSSEKEREALLGQRYWWVDFLKAVQPQNHIQTRFSPQCRQRFVE